MPRGRVGRLLALLGCAALAWGMSSGGAWAQGCATGACASFGTPCCSDNHCQMFHCPPWYHHCQERPPVICIKCGCPRPVCNPCGLPNFGYYQTCYIPWPLAPDWGHCPVPPPASTVLLGGPLVAPGTAPTNPLQKGPTGVTPPPRAVDPPVTLPPLPPLEEAQPLPNPRPLIPGPGTKQMP
jgi:hypothetical protein